MAVLVRQGFPPADVRRFIQDAQQRGCEAPAGLGSGVLFRSFDDGDGQGRNERACGSDAFAGEAVERAFAADEVFGDELRTGVGVDGGSRCGGDPLCVSSSLSRPLKR